MRRRALASLAAILAATACGDDGATSMTADPVTVVDVAAQPCTRPTRDRGLGVLVGPELVVTAAHTVEGPRREITVAGAPAEVIAVDVRRDLALLSAPGVAGPPATLAIDRPDPGEQASIRLIESSIDVAIVATGPLTVTNVSDGTRVAREVHTFEPGVAEGTSGAPLVDGNGAVAGIVVIDRDDRDQAYATTADELSGLLSDVAADPGRHGPENPIGCEG